MKAQAPFSSWQGMYNQGLLTDQSDRRIQNNTGNSSNYELIPTPLASQGMSMWGQLTGKANSNIHQLTGDMTGKRTMLQPIKIKIWLHTVFLCCILQLFSLCWSRRPINITKILGFPWWWTFSSTWCQWMWNVPINIQTGTWHMTTGKTTDQLLNRCFCLFMAKQWDVKDSSIFLDFSNFQKTTIITWTWALYRN
jgi:hypothetical protein